MSSISNASSRLVVLAAALISGFCGGVAKANTIAITNGSFETTSLNASNQIGYHGDGTTAVQQVAGWTNQTNNGTLGYTFLFQNGSASAYGNSGNVSLWTTSNGGVNTITASPDGGNFIALDGAYQTAPLTTQLSGLTIGSQLTVSFYYAGAQQKNFDGPTTESLFVGLFNNTTSRYEQYQTAVLQNANHGFTGWQQASVTFTPTATSQTLYFLAAGTPSGAPPFTLLDGVTARDNVGVTPEPSSLALLGTGVLTAFGMLRRRRSVI